MGTILDLPPEDKVKQENILIIAIIPGLNIPKNIFSFLYPTLQDLLVLVSTGITAVSNNKASLYKARLAVVIGDIIGIAELCMHSGHTSYCGCRVCTIVGDVKENRKSGIYFSNKALLGCRMRNKEDFVTGNAAHGIKKPTPFSLLDSFTGVCFFGLDELHLWDQNIVKQIWSVLGGKLLEAQSLGNKYAQDGKFINMATSAGYGRAIDYIDFLMYVVPSLLVEAIELQVEDLKAKRAKENEKRSKKRSRKGKERAVEPKDDIDDDIDDLVSCFDQTSEALTARSLERIIGLCKEKIKSRSKPDENAINFLRGNSVHSQQKWYTYKESNEDDFKEHSKITSDLLNDTLDPDGLPFNVMLRDFCSSNRLMFDCEETMFIREEYILSHNNQILKKAREKDGIDVVVQRNSESGSVKYSLVNIQAITRPKKKIVYKALSYDSSGDMGANIFEEGNGLCDQDTIVNFRR
ncbi:hypothetical protein INT48_001696 [Thamnidium elegans]|uniref:Uncharacterized protein n=1 Tax=Thamnidium elegans TaxID=101142 RepID=A0A8H7SRZ9_9FUNG|nr:hypothetical protein INT48_001696 [Thamnidium elegans]